MATDQSQIIDELLVIEAQCGDRACLDLLVDRWSPRVRATARRLTGDESGAEDVSQEAWAAIARGLGKLRDPASFGAWASGITRRKAADWIRARQRDRQSSGELFEQPDNGASSDRDPEDLSRLRLAIRRLPPDRRAALFLLYVEGLSVAQIGSLLGVPAGTVKSRLFQARAELRGLMGSQGDSDGKP